MVGRLLRNNGCYDVLFEQVERARGPRANRSNVIFGGAPLDFFACKAIALALQPSGNYATKSCTVFRTIFTSARSRSFVNDTFRV